MSIRQIACIECGTDIEGDTELGAASEKWMDRGGNYGDDSHRHAPSADDIRPTTQDALTQQVDSVKEKIMEYARQIESGEYGNDWIITRDDTGDLVTSVYASSADEAIEKSRMDQPPQDFEVTAELDGPNDEPTVDETPISEWPLSVEVKVGRPLAVVISTGGPHIEIVHDLSEGSAKLAGYWGGEQVYRHGKEFQTVLDYFTDSLWDEVPDEYK